MKKIINGKKYNTDTAKAVGTFSNNAYSWSDFSHFEETLYVKSTGEFFLFGSGGPNTKYAEYLGNNSWSGGSEITPMSEHEAREWAETHIDADEYEAIFGEVEE